MDQQPVHYLYDGTFDGLLTAVAVAVKSGESIAGVSFELDPVPTLLFRTRRVETDRNQAQRLFRYLTSQGTLPARLVINGYLSEATGIGSHICRLVQGCLIHGSMASRDFACESVRALHRIDRKVSFEAHRLYGLTRFRILKDGLQYAPLEPDHNVIWYCADHFAKRLGNRRWMLHDIRRRFALYWDGSELQPVEVDARFTEHVKSLGEVPFEEMDSNELHYQGLWRSFHQAISNPSRENRALQRQLMPRRYWKYLTER